MSARILVLEDDESLRLVITKALSRAGFEVRATASPATAIDRAIRGEADLLIADVLLGQENFLDRIDEITRARPDFPVIVISAQTTAATAINAARRGARRYLPKPFDLDDLVDAAGAALSGRQPAERAARPAESFAGLIGRSGAMQSVFQAIGRLASNRLPVLLTGPEGSGRATAARALHKARGVRDLVEAGPARLDAQGLGVFEQGADGFLLRRAHRWSEIAQACVLEFLESARGIPVYVTAGPDAANRLDPALFNRLAAAEIALPPLYTREGDARLIFEQALIRLESRLELGADAVAFIGRWSWPGEVLEVERAASRLVLSGQQGPVSAAALQQVLIPSGSREGDDIACAVEQAAARHFATEQADTGKHIQDIVDAALIRAALAHCGGVRRDAAAKLGWNRNTLARRIEALKLDL